jgi:hypothetical protein
MPDPVAGSVLSCACGCGATFALVHRGRNRRFLNETCRKRYHRAKAEIGSITLSSGTVRGRDQKPAEGDITPKAGLTEDQERRKFRSAMRRLQTELTGPGPGPESASNPGHRVIPPVPGSVQDGLLAPDWRQGARIDQEDPELEDPSCDNCGADFRHWRTDHIDQEGA